MTSVKELNDDLNKRYKEKYTSGVNKLLDKVLESESPTERANAILKLRNFSMKMHGKDYKWHYEKFVPESTNDEITQLVNSNLNWVYPREDVYFRKANFVYAFFQDYLVGECCVVTKDMVYELINRCEQVLAAAHEDGWVDSKGKLVDKIANWNEQYKREQVIDYIAKLKTDWKDLAANLLPTQSGSFFGSTEYDAWYLYDVKSCVNQFKKLMRTWKDDEYVYNVMSW